MRYSFGDYNKIEPEFGKGDYLLFEFGNMHDYPIHNQNVMANAPNNWYRFNCPQVSWLHNKYLYGMDGVLPETHPEWLEFEDWKQAYNMPVPN